ncbi:uncharacterized protein HD556DRAFT_1448451 [Suillus plorans]|uniref:Uncharacterized protein n=1 Tax=Suillus plorans TaxID=116603 RepID=A0A9P7AFJ2_9AGAM|nr:uncharacterized protein HD556DRAFT_1448451 [Suillus plorans]KAG1787770.1 hypothetical protein HD556DRAFT_1448451 [Suillus plorans]
MKLSFVLSGLASIVTLATAAHIMQEAIAKRSYTEQRDLLPNAEKREELDANDFNYFDYCTCP